MTTTPDKDSHMKPIEISMTVGTTTLYTESAGLAEAILPILLGRGAAAAGIEIKGTLQTVPATIAIGEPWPGQGGIFAGTMRGRDGHPDYHLIVAGPEHDSPKLQWGGYEQESPAASRWDGQANTNTLVSSTTDHPAAQWADAFEHEGHSDYYLAAQAEQSLLMANVPHLFGKGWYWSSTQYSAYGAYNMSFEDGWQTIALKHLERLVRPVRSIPIQ